MSGRARLIAGGIFFALMFAYAAGGAYQTFATRRSTAGWLASISGGRVRVETVSAGGPAAALNSGDEVVAVDGEPVGGTHPVFDLMRRPPGHSYSVTVLRGGERREFRLQTAPVPPFTKTFLTLLTVVIPAFFLATGLAVFLLRPGDKQAWLLALMFGMFVPSFPDTLEGLPEWMLWAMVLGGVVSCFFAAVFFHFFLIFPERSPLLKRFPRLEVMLYVPQALFFAPVVGAMTYLQAFAPESFQEREADLALPNAAVSVLLALYVAAGVASLLFNYRHAGRQSRRKMRVVVAGCMIGFLPTLLLMAVYFYGPSRLDASLLRWLSAGAALAFLFFPLSFAYAIVRHKVIPVRLIIRRGIRYVFASQGSVLLEIIVVGLALVLFLRYMLRFTGTTNTLAVGVVAGVFSVVVWNLTSQLHHRVIAPAIDRRFFRRAYNAQQILSDLGQALRLMTDMREMTSLVATKSRDALQTENVSIFLRDAATGAYACAASSQHAGGENACEVFDDLYLPGDAFVVRRLRESPLPLVVNFDDPQSWASMLLSEEIATGPVRRREGDTLRRVKSALLLPVASKNELLGVISLGPRLGDLPFSREDRQMLMAVAWQMALAVDNARLIRRKVEEERLLREIEMAKDVQRRLFPDCAPPLLTAELAGVCHPARGVGGDYYDFIQLGGDCVGVAVADVAGKGISAALLMSTVQASLRSQAPTVGGRLTELVSSMNRLLNRSTDSASYASFFYAQYDERTRALTYVNAGHNPPIILDGRAPDGDGRAARFLTTGGPVIGLFDEFTYEQETIQFEPGDVLVAYTDGVTEALNPRGEEFGEERLARAVARLAHLPAEDVVARLSDALAEWARDTPQHDDVTLVVLKVK
ncbi:MAG TPA: SpoIIE family protein phosphatase [Pyrinomonadaceae bacterium]|nr:SpoIIE family protein phosphatase [Pyrinomonadaceae bacterium]